jgi:hypothetical protein
VVGAPPTKIAQPTARRSAPSAVEDWATPATRVLFTFRSL